MLANAVNSVKNVFAIADLRTRVLFTLLLLAVYRIGAQIPTPGVNGAALSAQFESAGGIFGFLDMFTGRALSNFTIFALGIMPYISASIILQLLTVVVPYLEKLSKEGEVGRRKITQYTRYGTVVLSIVQGLGIAVALERAPGPPGFGPIVPHGGWAFRFIAVLTLTTGTAFIMWLGEQITERGIGNGISLIIFAGIVVGLMPAIIHTGQAVVEGSMNIVSFILIAAIMVAVCALIVFVERGQRRFQVQYAKRVVGRKVYGGQSTHLPLKVNTSGVIPVIFASSLILLPQTLFTWLQDKGGWVGDWAQRMHTQLSWGYPLYNFVYIGGIIFFCYFYTSIIFNPNDVADNMRKYGGFIPGIRPGRKTADYIYKVLTRITFGGALYLAAVAVLPEFLISGFKVQMIPVIGPSIQNFLDWIPGGHFVMDGLGVQFYFGGTSLLIVIGVAMDTIQQIESQLIMRHYDGFVKKTRDPGPKGVAVVDIVFIGPPGAGKGTQAKTVSGILGVSHVSTGDLLRAAIQSASALGAEARSYMDRGQLVPDRVVDEMVEAKLASDECRKGVLLDGYPRNLTQARVLEETEARLGRRLDSVVLLEVDDSVLEARLTGRRVCPNDKALYHVTERPPRHDMKCDECGGDLVVRSDDQVEVVRARLAVYHRETEPIVQYFKDRGIVKSVVGTGSIETVTHAVLAALGHAS